MRVSNSLGTDQAWHSVWSDLVPNFLQKLSADDTRRQRVNIKLLSRFQTLDYVIPTFILNYIQTVKALVSL